MFGLGGKKKRIRKRKLECEIVVGLTFSLVFLSIKCKVQMRNENENQCHEGKSDHLTEAMTLPKIILERERERGERESWAKCLAKLLFQLW